MSNKTLIAAKNVIQNSLDVKKEEKLLIVTDTGKLELAQIFLKAGEELGLNAVLVSGVSQKGGEMPNLCEIALSNADVALLITSGSFTHTKGRAKASERGCRIGSMPTITKEIVDKTLSVNYDQIEKRGTFLAEKLSLCKEIKITTKLGTDLTLYCDGRAGIADTGKLNFKGAFGNLPAGEAMVAPIENKGNGRLVVDGVIAGVGMINSPLTLEFENGKILDVKGSDSELFMKFVSEYDDTSFQVCEFGIGTNEYCQIMGNPLVDEKVFGTIHVACGNNLFMGGKQGGNIHYDMIVKYPTVYLDDECIIKDGIHIY